MVERCKTEGCERPAKSRGMCNTCYERWRKAGADGVQLRQHRKPGLADEELLAHIMSRTLPDPSGCVIWQGAVSSTGYGSTTYQGKVQNAHAVVLKLVTGSNGDGLDACHSLECVSRLCVNPDHLRWDSRLNNIYDIRSLGRGGSQKLTAEQVDLMRSMADEGESVPALAAAFKVGARHVRKILRREIWM